MRATLKQVGVPEEPMLATHRALLRAERRVERARAIMIRANLPPRRQHREALPQPGAALPRSSPIQGGQHWPDEGGSRSSSTAGGTSFRPTRPGGFASPSRERSPTRRGPFASPVHLIETLNRITRVKAYMEQVLGREPTDEELGERAGDAAGADLAHASARQEPDLSRDPRGRRRQPRGRLHRGPLLREPPPESLVRDDLRVMTGKVLKSLSAREEKILRMRFGIGERAQLHARGSRAQLQVDPRAHPPDRGEGPSEAPPLQPQEPAVHVRGAVGSVLTLRAERPGPRTPSSA